MTRSLWHLFEAVHAVVYFAPEVTAAYKRLGLKGFWMGYFAGRAAPLGPVPPEVVTAVFFNFHPSMVERAIPDAWSLASPEDVMATRLAAVEEVLRAAVEDQSGVAEAAELLSAAAGQCSVAGRALFAGYAASPWPDEPLPRLWHAATLLREHRGDGHVAALVAHGLDGLEAHVLVVGAGSVPRDAIQPHRGWSDEDWEAAAQRLVERGLLDGDGRLTSAGADVRQAVEDATDRLAAAPWEGVDTERAAALLRPIAAAIGAKGLIPYPNPIGLPGSSS